MTNGGWTRVINFPSSITAELIANPNQVSIDSLTDQSVFSKLSDQDINILSNGSEYWKFECANTIRYVTNDLKEYTSEFSNFIYMIHACSVVSYIKRFTDLNLKQENFSL